MRKNLKTSTIVEELGEETRLNRVHALSSVQYIPTSSTYKVKSTGKFLRTFLGNAKKFDPFAFSMTEEAKAAEEAREKTLSVDFTIARSPAQQVGEDPILPNISEMLSKCYNRFLYIARCMETGDEFGVWTALKDGIFSTAHNLTRIHDARVTLSTGSRSYTNRANTENGMLREKVKERMKKEGVRKGFFFREGGGPNNPPLSTFQNITTSFSPYDLLPAPNDEEDLLVGSVLADSVGRGNPSRGRGGGNPNTGRNPNFFRGNFQGRGNGGPPTQPAFSEQQRRGRGAPNRGGGGGQRRGGSGAAGQTWGNDRTGADQPPWGNR
jgi:hypothetical protein